MLEEHQRRQQLLQQQQQQQQLQQQLQQQSFKAFGLEERLQSYSSPIGFSALAAAIKSEPAGLAEVVTDPPGSNTIAGEPIGTSVLPTRVQANLNSIEEAGVGPMAPLVDDDGLSRMSVSSSNDNDNDERGGEETETAPEAEGEDDSVTRCICDFLHDDGYMICCDKCL